MYLFIDTETTGLPLDYEAPIEDTDNWPRIVQLAWQLHDNKGQLLTKRNDIILPEGFSIPRKVSEIHGITDAMARDRGIPLIVVISLLVRILPRVQLIVGHNIFFDRSVLGAELIRTTTITDFLSKPTFCTMRSTTDLCKIPRKGYTSYKLPKLEELYYHLFGDIPPASHDAAHDVEMCARCFFGIIELGFKVFGE